ncbi:hypothetical protein LWF01_15005 [Saxibacter everestensis]|uniref:Uncharacterized protein n=1 Tax=Saxibacter everestensis TaxID=2909229 RepID=A0ABY8QQW6_9MICO|nr:hypothetical protein LWF01_15005 [Brevibacteriaceae bacterium ZFBP1038]
MKPSRLVLNGSAAASAGLAAAIAMAIAQIVFLSIGDETLHALAIGVSLSTIAFGVTYAAIFFVALARTSGEHHPTERRP